MTRLLPSPGLREKKAKPAADPINSVAKGRCEGARERLLRRSVWGSLGVAVGKVAKKYQKDLTTGERMLYYPD